MEYTSLGTTGTRVRNSVSEASGSAKYRTASSRRPPDQARELLDTAADRGINFFDTANRYGGPAGTSEEHLGEWLESRP